MVRNSTIQRLGDGKLAVKTRNGLKGIPETVVFTNHSDKNCVVWFFNEDTFGKHAIRLTAKEQRELRFIKPVVHTSYAVCEECVTMRDDTSEPEIIPGGGKEDGDSSDGN